MKQVPPSFLNAARSAYNTATVRLSDGKTAKAVQELVCSTPDMAALRTHIEDDVSPKR